MSRLELRDVSAAYRDRQVLSGVSASVPGGGWLAVIGTNGAGKSTLLKAVGGLIAHHGSVRLAGTELATLPPRRRARSVAYAPQNPLLPPALTVTDYALLGRTPHLRPLGREGARDLAVVSGVLQRLDLVELADRRLATLSGGEAQRAVLARALAQQAELLLLDEPTSGLDVGHAQALLELVDRLRAEDGVTVVTTLHDLTLAGQYAGSLLLLDGGHPVAQGRPDEVLTVERIAHHYDAHVAVVDTGGGAQAVLPVRRSGQSTVRGGRDAASSAPPESDEPSPAIPDPPVRPDPDPEPEPLSPAARPPSDAGSSRPWRTSSR